MIKIEDTIQETIQHLQDNQTASYVFDDDELWKHVGILNDALENIDHSALTNARTRTSYQNKKRRCMQKNPGNAQKIAAAKPIANLLLNLTGIDLSFIEGVEPITGLTYWRSEPYKMNTCMRCL